MSKSKPQSPLTKIQFMSLLKKAIHPMRRWFIKPNKANCLHEHIEMGRCLSCGKLVWNYTDLVPTVVRRSLHFNRTNRNYTGRVKGNMSDYPSVMHNGYEWKRVIVVGDIGENFQKEVVLRRKGGKHHA